MNMTKPGTNRPKKYMKDTRRKEKMCPSLPSPHKSDSSPLITELLEPLSE